MDLLYKYIEYFGFLSGLLYLIFEIKQVKLMWLVGVLSAIAYIIVFAESSLFAAMGLQVYYLIISVYGWFEWKRGKKELENESNISIFYRNPSKKVIAVSFAAFILIFILLLTILKNLTGDPMPVADAIATSLSIVATYWLSKSYRAQWLIWVVVNIITVGLCLTQSLYVTSILYVIYAVSAVYGYFHWGKRGSLLV
ncbi:MAG: nicotinamide riboside transporter PnuC [Bacteroidales bacterium]